MKRCSVRFLFHASCTALWAALAMADEPGDDRQELWRLADKITPTLEQGIESQLTFDGQFAALSAEGAAVLDALLLLVSEETTPFEVRVYAARALADVAAKLDAQERVLARVRELHADVLIVPALRDQLGILRAIFGDTTPLLNDIRRLEKLVKKDDPGIIILGNRDLATLYYRIRDYEKAVASYDRVLEVYESLYEARKEAGARAEVLAGIETELALHYYNAACSNALHGDIEKAKTLLKKAVRYHVEHFQNIEKDGDLTPLREHSSYAEFREELRQLLEGLSL